jgi:two-component system, OmpR family, response regulator
LSRILVVEDDVEVCEVVCEFLRENGHMVLAADSAQQARKLLRCATVDVLLIDCVMSGERGDSLAEHAASLGIPAILTSGDLRYRETMEQSGVPFLSKPFRLAELGAIIDRVAPAPQ